jgi:hypothetical protein
MSSYEMHASLKQIARNSGRSSVAAAAYRSAECFHDERTGIRHDFTHKNGVEYLAIIAPDNAPDWAHQRAWLWNEVERRETKANATTAHEMVIGFPEGFQKNHRIEAGEAIASEVMSRYHCVVDIALHEPNRNGDDRNFHMHMMFTTRGLDPAMKDGWAKTKYRDLSQDKMTVEGKSTTRGQQEVLGLRAFIAEELNRIAEREHIQTKTEHLSFEARGIDQVPTHKMGPTATKIEREGKQSERGDMNRDIQTSNNTLSHLKGQEKIIVLEYEREKRRLEKAIEAEEQAKEQAALKARAEKQKAALAEHERKQRAGGKEDVKAPSDRQAPEKKPFETVKMPFSKAANDNQAPLRAGKESAIPEKQPEPKTSSLFDRLNAREELINQWHGQEHKKIEELAHYYDVAGQRKALMEAEREAGRKFGFFERLLGKQKAAQEQAEVLRLNLQNAEQRFKENIETIYRQAPSWMKDQELKRFGFEPSPKPEIQPDSQKAFLERIERESTTTTANPNPKNTLFNRLEARQDFNGDKNQGQDKKREGPEREKDKSQDKGHGLDFD